MLTGGCGLARWFPVYVPGRCLLRARFPAPDGEQLSSCELLFAGEMMVDLIRKQISVIRLIFPWLPHHLQPRHLGGSFYKQK